jgi:GGDEF domain-containing protein
MTAVTELLGQLAQQAEEVLLQADGQVALVVAGMAVAGWLAGILVGRRASALRLPVGATVGLSGVLWVASQTSIEVTVLLGLALAICWAVALLQLAVQLARWIVVRFRTPWRLDRAEDSAVASVGQRRFFVARLDQELSRVKQGSQRAVAVAAIDAAGRGRRRRRVLRENWQRAQHAARAHDVLYRTDEGTVLAILPDTVDEQLASWLAEFHNPTTGAVVGYAVFPEDGRSIETLVDNAVARMWMQQGIAADLEQAAWRPEGQVRGDPSCIPLADEDLVFVDSGPRLSMEQSLG